MFEQPEGYIVGDVWYTWTAPESGRVAFGTANLPFGVDTVLAVVEGSALDGLTGLGTNDDYPSCCTSRVVFEATAGTTYHIAVPNYRKYGPDPADIRIGPFDLVWNNTDLLDTLAPDLAIESATAGRRTATLTWFADDETAVPGWLTVTCQIDDGTAFDCESGAPISLPGGRNTITVSATDGAGNVTTDSTQVRVQGSPKP